MADIFVLALGAAFYPTLLAIVIVILSRPRPARLLAAYLAGGLVAGLGAGFLIVFGLKGAGLGTSRNPSKGSAILDIAAGAISLGLAAALVTGRDPRPGRLKRRAAESKMKPKRPSWTERTVGRDSLKMAFGIGVLLDLPSVWYLIALKDIASGSYSTAGQVALIVAFNLIMFMVLEVPLVAYLIAPERAAAAVARFDAWLHAHVRMLSEVVAGAVGVYLVVKGVREL